jgi:hypothetical protein
MEMKKMREALHKEKMRHFSPKKLKLDIPKDLKA